MAFDGRTDGPVLRVLREVWPDLKTDGTATRYKGVRAVPGAVDDQAGQPAQGDYDLAAPGTSLPTYLELIDGTTRWLAALAAGILIVADTGQADRFGDALYVQTDPGGAPSLADAFVVAAGTPAVLVMNAHHNSGEGFADYALIGLVEGRLRPLFDGPGLYSSFSGDERCDERSALQELKTFRPLGTQRDGYVDLALEIVETRECRKGGKVVQASSLRASAVLTWDANEKRYKGDLKSLDRLSKRPR